MPEEAPDQHKSLNSWEDGFQRPAYDELHPEVECCPESISVGKDATVLDIMHLHNMVLLDKKMRLHSASVNPEVCDFASLLTLEQQRTYDILLNKKYSVRVPITTYDNPLVDQVRSDAIVSEFESNYLVIDQCPYQSDEYKGLCRLFFVLRPQQHLLQLILSGPTQSKRLDTSNARMNREVDLKVFNIDKINPNPLGDQELDSNYAENYDDRMRQQGLLHEAMIREKSRIALSVIEVVRQLKEKFTGRIYDDFYYFGTPVFAFDQSYGYSRIHLAPTRELMLQQSSTARLNVMYGYLQENIPRFSGAPALLEHWSDLVRKVVVIQGYCRRRTFKVKRLVAAAKANRDLIANQARDGAWQALQSKIQ